MTMAGVKKEEEDEVTRKRPRRVVVTEEKEMEEEGVVKDEVGVGRKKIKKISLKL